MYRRNVCVVRMLKPELDTFLPFMDSVLHLTTTAKYTHTSIFQHRTIPFKNDQLEQIILCTFTKLD